MSLALVPVSDVFDGESDDALLANLRKNTYLVSLLMTQCDRGKAPLRPYDSSWFESRAQMIARSYKRVPYIRNMYCGHMAMRVSLLSEFDSFPQSTSRRLHQLALNYDGDTPPSIIYPELFSYTSALERTRANILYPGTPYDISNNDDNHDVGSLFGDL